MTEPTPQTPSIPLADSRAAMVGRTPVRRALPQRTRRTVGAWCFADHIGPVSTVAHPADAGIGPHPHIGLQTVTWLLEGTLRHVDSLGSDQLVEPGQLNLMTAGRGVVHAEEWRGGTGRYHGIQLWVAQPEATRHGEPAFEHHDVLPRLELDAATATVLVGDLAGVTSPARGDSDHVGVELRLRAGSTAVPLRVDHEHALVVLEGSVRIEASDQGHRTRVEPGRLAYLEPGRDQMVLSVDDDAVALCIGGTPFEARVTMWWNFVARDRDEIAAARADWNARDPERFGPVSSTLAPIAAPALPWSG